MNWFKGEIAEAIVTSKAKKAVFVVYVEGKDEKSTQISQLINNEDVAKILGGDSFVAIKIESESVPYQQFSQIYKQVPVPSLYFIGKQGVPLEIVTEAKDVKTFTDKLNVILQKGDLAPLSKQSEAFINKEQTSSQLPPNVVCDNGVCSIVKKEDTPSTSQQSTPLSQDVENKKEKELSVEEKAERAKQLIEMKREEKRREEAESDRQREIERRKAGQSVQQLKRWQDEQELKQVLEEREKEKREGQAARDRVLAQIAQDRAERAAKFSSPPPQPQQPQAPQPAPRAAPSNTARLQFRMPDGRTATNDFSSADTLSSVHAHIRANLNLPFSTYTLSTTFPRREFTDQDKLLTLADLGLVPTAVVLILPVNRSGVIATSSGGGITGFLWSLLTPIFAVLGYLRVFLFGSGPEQSEGQRPDSNKRAAESSNEPRPQPKVRRAGETTVVRRQGNIHRLSNKNDSDDENNTWNGNSTQQM